MKLLTLMLCVIPAFVTTITISPNGNSPEIKMVGGMMVDVQKGFTPMASNKNEAIIAISNYEKSRRLVDNSTKLSINERYRRLIPYMTFYYANDLATLTTEANNAKNVEVEKAEIIEATTIGQSNDRQPKKIFYPSYRNIPRYQGNRLTQYNIASANPTKLLYKEIVPVYQNVKVTPNYNPLLSEGGYVVDNDYDYQKIPPKQIIKSPSAPFLAPTRKPYVNLYNNDDSANIRYYLSEKEQAPKFKLVPYEQTPVAVLPQNEQYYEPKKPFRVLLPKDQVYIKPRPLRPQLYYDNANIQQLTPRKPSSTVAENYYEQRTRPVLIQPIVESGFKPMTNPSVVTTEAPIYRTSLPEKTSLYYDSLTQKPIPESYDTQTVAPKLVFNPNYYQYVVEQQAFKPSQEVEYKPQIEQPAYNPAQHSIANSITLSDLINSLQLNKSIPNPITKENVGSSIRTLLKVLNGLKAVPNHNEVEPPVLSTPTPFVSITPEVVVEVTAKPVIDVTPAPIDDEIGLHEEPYLAPVKTPSQHLDELPRGTTSQRFPLLITSDDDGGTPGRPGVDYPTLTTIPQTRFNCKTQRYKGFFADPETRCQVWHYCDLNGGQASFLCPNGTIFSQAALTCDWWFNVRCSSTAQLYVLNESLYKYILPHSPKFPEDYSGPLVDKYLTLKFKEMEEQFKKNKNKKTASDKMDEDDSEESTEQSESTSAPEQSDDKTSDVSEASVIVDSPGSSGNVERLSE